MPVAQRYGQRKVTLDKLAGARLTAGETDVSSGAALHRETANTHRAAAALGEQAFRISAGLAMEMAQEAKQRADETAFLEATNEFTKTLNEWQYHPETGAYGKKGKAAMNLPNEFEDVFTKTASSVSANLATPEQRVAFTRWLNQQHDSTSVSVMRHVSAQMDAYEAGEARAAVANAQASIATNYQDPREVGRQLAFGESVIRRQAKNAGAGPEATDQAITDFRTQAHTGVIERFLANGETTKAKAYFEGMKDQIKGEALEKIERALHEGTIREQTQDALGTILGDETLDTLEKQRAAARKQYSGELEDRVLQGIEHEAALKENADRDKRVQVMVQAKNAIERSHGRITAVSPSDWVELTPQEAATLRNYADMITQKKPIVTDFNTQYRLKRMAAEQPDEFRKVNLNAFIDRVSGTDLDELANIQTTIIRGDAKAAEKQLGGFMTQSQVVNDTMVQYGFNPNAKDDTDAGRAVSLVRNILDREVQAEQQATGKEMTNDAIRKKLQEILSTNIEVKQSLWGIVPWGTAQSSVANLTIGDVGSRRPILEQALTAAGRPMDDASLVQFDAEVRLRLGNVLDETAIARIPVEQVRTLAAALQARNITPTPSALMRLYLEVLAGGGLKRR